MSPIQYVLIVVVLIGAFIMKTLLGFGHSLITIPILSFVFPLDQAIVISTLGETMVNLIILLGRWKDIKKNVKMKKHWTLLGGLMIGTFVGVFVLRSINIGYLKKFFGISIIFYTLMQFVKVDVLDVSEGKKKLFGTLMGLWGGISGAVCGVNGPPLFMYFSKVKKNKSLIRLYLISLFLIDSIWRSALFVQGGMLGFEEIKSFCFLLLPTIIAGLGLGRVIDKLVCNDLYKQLGKVLLIVIGVKMLV